MSDTAMWMDLLAALIVLAVIVVVIRQIAWWYFGIGRALETLERIDRRLKIMLENQITPPPP